MGIRKSLRKSNSSYHFGTPELDSNQSVLRVKISPSDLVFTFFSQVSLSHASTDFFVYVSPDPIGVNAFLEMGKTGTEAAAKKYQAEVQTYESSTAAARRENVEAGLNEGASLIVLLGFEFNDIITEVAPTAP